jgi:serralysin
MIDATLNEELDGNILLGDSNNDTLHGGSQNDIISVFGGNNSIFGGKGDDILTGAGGNDTIYGEEGNDILIGLGGNNFLSGGSGNDTLTGGSIVLSSNNDLVVTADTSGTDTMTGGEGADRFVLGGKSSSQPGSNAPSIVHYDTAGNNDYALITDFDSSQDIILLGGSKDSYRLGSPPSGLPTGTALYLRDELIAILQGSAGLTLSGNYFQGSIG